MKILVTGANGQLGREMRIVSRDTNHDFVFTDVVDAEGVQTTKLDITNLEAIRRIVREERIDLFGPMHPRRSRLRVACVPGLCVP